jgi:hypothetical protein
MNIPWWEKEDKVHNDVFAACNNIRKNQTAQDELDERHFRMYSGLPLHSVFNMSMSFDNADIRFTMNIVQAATNTLVSKISKNKVRPNYLTQNGNWAQQEDAKKLDSFVFGTFYKSKVYQETKKSLRGACVFGDGFIKHWHDESGEIKIRNVFKPCLTIDQSETMYGSDPKTIYEIRLVDKTTLKAKYPDFTHEIDEAKISDLPFFVDSFESNTELCAVIEAFRVGSKSKKKNKKTGKEEEVISGGKHFIGISTATFHYEEFMQEKVPYIRFPFVPNIVGFFSKGVAELITGHQVEINRLLRRISKSMNLMSSPNILVDSLSKIVDTHFNNEVGSVIKYEGNMPHYNFPQGINATVIEWFLMIYQKAFEELGLSQLTAQSKKPEGLDSGKALREYNDIETERFAELAQNWEEFHLEIADAVIMHAEEMAKNGGKPVALSPDKFGAQKIDFRKINLKGTDYIRQAWPTSMLPKTPAGRLQYVQEMLGAGMIGPEDGLALLEFPDVAELANNKNAGVNDIKRTAHLIISEAEYNAPETYQNLDYGIQYMNSTYLDMKGRGLPEERLDMLQKWINDALTLKQQMQPPPQVPPGEIPI